MKTPDFSAFLPVSGALGKIALQIGPFAIHWYAVCIVLGAIIAIWLAMKEAPRVGLTSDDVIDLVLWMVPLGIVGARLYYVVFEWGYYSQNPDQIIAMWDGGGAIYGGLIAGGVVLFFFSRYRRIQPLVLLDIAVPGVLFAQGLGRWGNFFNQEAYGHVVTSLKGLPDFIVNQMYIDGAYRLPTFLYESLWDFLGFVLMLSLRHRIHTLKKGDLFAAYLIWYGLGRAYIEGLRTDSLMLFSLRVSQWLSGILVIAGVILLIFNHFKRQKRQIK